MIHPIDRRGSRPTPDFRFIKEARGALTITNVMAEDNGKWTCEAENAHGYSENARPVKLVVLGECQRGRPSCRSTFKLETTGWDGLPKKGFPTNYYLFALVWLLLDLAKAYRRRNMSNALKYESRNYSCGKVLKMRNFHNQSWNNLLYYFYH